MFLPRHIGIELVRGCNFDCPMCPVTAHAPLEAQRFRCLDVDWLEQMTTELDRWPSVDTIWFFHFGEPMVHPRYRACLEVLYRSRVARQATVIQHTNASVLHGDRAEAVLEVPVIKKLVVSFDGFGDKQSFERLRGPYYDRVLANVQKFAARARERRPDLKLSTCTILPRPGEVPGLEIPPPDIARQRLRELFAPMGLSVETRDMHDYNGDGRLALRGLRPERVFGGCAFVELDSLYFTVDGWAQPCCAVYDRAFAVGRFPSSDLGELLNGPQMREIRHSLRLDKRKEISHCRACSLSLGGSLSDEDFVAFWQARENAAALADPEERAHLHALLGRMRPHASKTTSSHPGSTPANGLEPPE
jgi:hypothetical protein